MNMPCPSCGSDIAIPEGFSGVQRQCTSCRKFAIVPPPSQRVPSQPAMEPADGEAAAPPARSAQTARPARRRVEYRRPVDRDEGPFEFERKGMGAGVVGGLAMMAIAGIWFFVALAKGIIFFYPPVLFFIGLIATINGLTSGGGRQRSPRPRRRRG